MHLKNLNFVRRQNSLHWTENNFLIKFLFNFKNSEIWIFFLKISPASYNLDGYKKALQIEFSTI